MAKFSSKLKNIVTFEGAEAEAKSVESEWVNALCSSFLGDSFYEDEDKRIWRYVSLTRRMVFARGEEFVGRAAIFARNVLGMRSVSALTAAVLNESSWKGKRQFYRDFFRRPDDVAEVFCAIDKLGYERSHALVRGAGDYLSSLSEYSLGKYKLSGREYNMYDLINITHAHSAAIGKYKNDTLPVPETWETSISAATDEADKAARWCALVEKRQLGYMALLRNLRNLIKYCGDKDYGWWYVNVCMRLVDKSAIHSSLVFPYRFYVAYKELDRDGMSDAVYSVVKAALGEAFIYSIDNMPMFDGNTLIALDVSGSMSNPISNNSKISIREVGACYAAMIAASGGFCDFVKFGTIAKLFGDEDYGNCDSIFDQIDAMAANDNCGWGTSLDTVWPLVQNQRYDRVFLISDMQVMESDEWWIQNRVPAMTFSKYCEACGQTPKVYSFDLGNYHDAPVSLGDISYFTALSPEVLKFIEILESGKSVCDYIDSCEWMRW